MRIKNSLSNWNENDVKKIFKNIATHKTEVFEILHIILNMFQDYNKGLVLGLQLSDKLDKKYLHSVPCNIMYCLMKYH